MKIFLWVDDERKAPLDTSIMNPDCAVITAKDYSSAVEVLGFCRDKGWEVYIDLDHDLGEGKTGYDICKFIVENRYPLLGCHLHTMNPVGMQNMYQLLSHYGYTLS